MRKRESFNSRWGFILACIGSAVGMGNIWMFPTRVSLYGGGAFLIPYFIFVILIGFTGVISEMSFGRATRSGPIDAFGIACESRGHRKAGEALGWIPVLGALAMAIGYTVVMGWILKYTIGTFTGAVLAPADIDGFAGAFGSMASSFGNNFWQTAALVICIIILMFGVGSGIEKANKIMMPVFFVLFIILGIYVAFQPGAVDGYHYIFRVDPKALADPVTWIFALGQAFFSLSVAGNGTLIYGSYLPDTEDVPASAAKVAFFEYHRRYAGCPGHYPCHGHHRCTARSGRSRIIIHLPASSDQSHARRKNNCYYLLCGCLFGRYVLSDEPL